MGSPQDFREDTLWDMLDNQFGFQEALAEKGKFIRLSEMTVQERIAYIKDNLFSLEHEGHELVNNMSWKHWADGTRFDRQACMEELADMFAFLFNIVLGVGFSDDTSVRKIADEMGQLVHDKVELNHERQQRPEGYKGVGGV